MIVAAPVAEINEATFLFRSALIVFATDQLSCSIYVTRCLTEKLFPLI